MTPKERAEANANLTLWCVHVLGPDDLHAMPTHEAAVVSAREMNHALYSKVVARTDDDVLCFAYAAPWPHSADAHAGSLAEERRARG